MGFLLLYYCSSFILEKNSLRVSLQSKHLSFDLEALDRQPDYVNNHDSFNPTREMIPCESNR
jgi:hypothetical protein